MSRNRGLRRACAALIAAASLLAASAGAGDTLMPDELLVPREPNYRTVTVGYGDYSKAKTTAAHEFYPDQADVRYEGEAAKFVDFTVKRGDVVEKGDVLAHFTIYASEVDLERARLGLSRSVEEYGERRDEWRDAIREMEDALARLPGDYERQRLRLELEKSRLEFQLYCLRQDKDIERRAADIERQRDRRNRTELYAPISGVIDNVAYKRPDDMVWYGEVLVTLHNPDESLLWVDNGSLEFRCGLPVTIETGTNKERYKVGARVVASDSGIPEKNRQGYALLQLDDSADEGTLRNPTATVEGYKLSGVLTAPRNSYTMDGGKYYVTKLEGGIVKRRYVVFGMQNYQEAWILAGVSEGDVLILD